MRALSLFLTVSISCASPAEAKKVRFHTAPPSTESGLSLDDTLALTATISATVDGLPLEISNQLAVTSSGTVRVEFTDYTSPETLRARIVYGDVYDEYVMFGSQDRESDSVSGESFFVALDDGVFTAIHTGGKEVTPEELSQLEEELYGALNPLGTLLPKSARIGKPLKDGEAWLAEAFGEDSDALTDSSIVLKEVVDDVADFELTASLTIDLDGLLITTPLTGNLKVDTQGRGLVGLTLGGPLTVQGGLEEDGQVITISGEGQTDLALLRDSVPLDAVSWTPEGPPTVLDMLHSTNLSSPEARARTVESIKFMTEMMVSGRVSGENKADLMSRMATAYMMEALAMQWSDESDGSDSGRWFSKGSRMARQISASYSSHPIAVDAALTECLSALAQDDTAGALAAAEKGAALDIPEQAALAQLMLGEALSASGDDAAALAAYQIAAAEGSPVQALASIRLAALQGVEADLGPMPLVHTGLPGWLMALELSLRAGRLPGIYH